MHYELMKSMKKSRKIKLIYLSDNKNVTKRTVKVIKINSATFTAYCFLRKSCRTFKINNTLAIVPIYEAEGVVV